MDTFWSSGGGHGGLIRHAVNGPWLDGLHDALNGRGAYATFGKPSAFSVIAPSMVFMIGDENPQSINDGALSTVRRPEYS